MRLISIAVLLSVLACWALASRLGAAVGGGVLSGFVVGAILSSAGVCWQLGLLRRGSSFVMQAFGISFLVKLVVLVGGALLLRFVPAAETVADWKGYLLAFPVAVLWVTSLWSFGTLRVLKCGGAV